MKNFKKAAHQRQMKMKGEEKRRPNRGCPKENSKGESSNEVKEEREKLNDEQD